MIKDAQMINSIIKIAFLPILVLQGLYISKTVERLPEAEGDRQGAKGCPKSPKIRILVLGDSAAAGVGANQQEEALLGQLVEHLTPHFLVEWELIAKTGATTTSTIKMLSKRDAKTFEVVVTSLGVNDVTSSKSQQLFIQEQQNLIRLLKEKFQAQNVIISGFPPVGKFPALPQPLRWYLGRRSVQFDQALQQLAHEEKIDYFEQKLDFVSSDQLKDIGALMASDGFHPGPPIYKIWGKEVAKMIREKF